MNVDWAAFLASLQQVHTRQDAERQADIAQGHEQLLLVGDGVFGGDLEALWREGIEQLLAEPAEERFEANLLPPGSEAHVRYWQVIANRMQMHTEGSIVGFRTVADMRQDRPPHMELTEEHLVGLTLNIQLQLELFRALDEHQIIHISCSLAGLAETIEQLRLAGITNMEQVTACGTTFGQHISRRLFLEFVGGNVFDNMALVTSIIGACQTVELLGMNFHGDDEVAELLPALEASISSKPNLRVINMEHIEIGTFRALSTALFTLPQASTVMMEGKHNGRLLTLSSLEDATRLANVVTMEPLDNLVVVNFCFDNVEVTSTVLTAFAASRFSRLTVFNWILPQSMYAELANAILQSRLTELAYQSAPGPGFLQALSDGLKNPATTLQRLYLGSFYTPEVCYFYTSNALSSFFNGSHRWKLRELILYIADWGEAFDKSISSYVKQNFALRKLKVVISKDYVGPPITSEALLNAVDLGARALEEITLGYEKGQVDPDWFARLEFLLSLNHERKRQAARFEVIVLKDSEGERRECLIEATNVVSFDILYEFIRRDEWDLQTLIADCCRQLEQP